MFTITPKKDLPSHLKEKLKVAIVFSNWHPDIVQHLVEGATQACHEKGISEDRIHYFSAPGAYELPQLVEKIARTKQFHAIIPVGCVIRGETNHFELIADTVAKSMDQIGRTHQVAVSLGVLTVENLTQAVARSSGTKGNKGSEAAHAAIDLAAELERVK